MKTLLLIIIALFSLVDPSVAADQGAAANLSFRQADSLAAMHYRQMIQKYVETIEDDWQSKSLKSNGYQMPFEYYVNGEVPEKGYPLYISMHGGGDATAEENDQQWENQKILYGAVDGVYFVPRAPTNSWNMWHQGYMEDLLLQIVTYSVARLNVDITRVYLLGYSAGGDGVYNLATRLSDRFAAAAMMAGHPNDAQIENLRNLPFAIYVGAEDIAYNRVGLAVEWLRAYEKLYSEDQGGFQYNINIYADKGHWMDGLDGEAIGWLAKHRRVSTPDRFIWIQDDVLHKRKYNLEVSNPQQGFKVEEWMDFKNNTIYLTSEHYEQITIWFDDFIANLENPVTIVFNGVKVFEGMVSREERNIIASLSGRLDYEYAYWGRVTVERP